MYKRGLNSLVHYEPTYKNVGEGLEILDITLEESEKLVIDVELPALEGTSTCCLGPDNKFRLLCQALVEKKWFGNIILLLIVICTCTLAFDSPLYDPNGTEAKNLEYIDLFMTCAFTFEMSAKIIAYGFAFAGKGSYIRDSWNILDFVIVSSALAG